MELQARGKGLACVSGVRNHLPLRGKLGWMTPRASVKTTLALRRAFRGSWSQAGAPVFAAFTGARLGFSHWNSTPADCRGEFFVNPLACTLCAGLNSIQSRETDRRGRRLVERVSRTIPLNALQDRDASLPKDVGNLGIAQAGCVIFEGQMVFMFVNTEFA